jgi:hypothetical protein
VRFAERSCAIIASAASLFASVPTGGNPGNVAAAAAAAAWSVEFASLKMLGWLVSVSGLVEDSVSDSGFGFGSGLNSALGSNLNSDVDGTGPAAAAAAAAATAEEEEEVDTVLVEGFAGSVKARCSRSETQSLEANLLSISPPSFVSAFGLGVVVEAAGGA